MKSIMLLLGLVTLLGTMGCVTERERRSDYQGGWGEDNGYDRGDRYHAFPRKYDEHEHDHDHNWEP